VSLDAAIRELIDAKVAEAEARLRAEFAASGNGSASPYMTVVEAAAYLRCDRQRIDDLLSQRRLTRHKDGTRTLVSRAELEHYVEPL
jgi:excisionase family DNA binding protein